MVYYILKNDNSYISNVKKITDIKINAEIFMLAYRFSSKESAEKFKEKYKLKNFKVVEVVRL